jgi:hypothetical protein
MARIVPRVLVRMNNLTLRCATPCLSFWDLNLCLEMRESRFALGQGVELIVTSSIACRSQGSMIFRGVDAVDGLRPLLRRAPWGAYH